MFFYFFLFFTKETSFLQAARLVRLMVSSAYLISFLAVQQFPSLAEYLAQHAADNHAKPCRVSVYTSLIVSCDSYASLNLKLVFLPIYFPTYLPTKRSHHILHYLGCSTLDELRQKQKAVMMFKIVNGLGRIFF